MAGESNRERDRFFARPAGEDRERLRATFDTVAVTYHHARPRYPDALYADLTRLAGLRRGDRLLEVGCGTGIATRPMLDRGFSVVAIEPGARLAAQAGLNLRSSAVEVVCTDFESFRSPTVRFDLVFAATAWHWVNPEVRYRRAHALLRPGGHLAFWNALHAFPTDFDPFFEEIGAIYEQIGWPPSHDWPPPTPDQIADDVDEILATTLFDDVRTRRYVWDVFYTAEQYIALLDTFSSHIAMPAAKRQPLYSWIRKRVESRPTKRIRRHWYAIMHVAHAR